jgi:hypothetical protein
LRLRVAWCIENTSIKFLAAIFEPRDKNRKNGCEAMTRKEVYWKIMSLMDTALVRGANHFTNENAAALKSEQTRWIAMGGSSAEKAIIDQFLSVTSMARGEPDDRVRSYTDRATELKGAWRNVGAPE